MGSSSGGALKEGANNIIVGNGGASLDTSYNNVMLGNNIGVFYKKGNNNTLIGNQAANTTTTGYSNVFIGERSGASSDSLSNNIFIGSESGRNTKNANVNVFIGNRAGLSNVQGAGNVYIGNNAGANNNGFNNIILGQVLTDGVATKHNKLLIDNLNTATPFIEGDFLNETLSLRSDVTTRTIQLEKYSSEPNTCTSVTEGQLYYDSSSHTLKLCTDIGSTTYMWIDLN